MKKLWLTRPDDDSLALAAELAAEAHDAEAAAAKTRDTEAAAAEALVADAAAAEAIAAELAAKVNDAELLPQRMTLKLQLQKQ